MSWGSGGDFQVSGSRFSLNLTLSSDVIPSAQPVVLALSSDIILSAQPVTFESFTRSVKNSDCRTFQKLPSLVVLSFLWTVLFLHPNRAYTCQTRAWGSVWFLCLGWERSQRN